MKAGKVEITTPTIPTYRFDSIRAGSFFRYDSVLFIKTDDDYGIRISTGEQASLSDDEQVMLVDVTITYKVA